MELNNNFSQRVVVHGAQVPWQDSPMPGVRRRMLDRIGDEVARATTIVSYAPNSQFSPHVHHGGEEFVVLEGVFEDEHGSYPAGSYVRNPPKTAHTPGSSEGCVMLVKLWQFDPHDRTPVVLNFDSMAAQVDSERAGARTIPLHQDDREHVRVEVWAANSQQTIDTGGGAELFVLDGGFEESSDTFERHSWLRLPAGAPADITAGADGARVWIKSGHLTHACAPAS